MLGHTTRKFADNIATQARLPLLNGLGDAGSGGWATFLESGIMTLKLAEPGRFISTFVCFPSSRRGLIHGVILVFLYSSLDGEGIRLASYDSRHFSEISQN